MHHPELLLLPFFLFANYFLARIGTIQAAKQYNQHFKAPESLVLGERQQQKAAGKWFNPGAFLLYIVYSALAIWYGEFGWIQDSFLRGLFGCVLGALSLQFGRSLCNLLVFCYTIRNPDEISGQVTFAQGFLLANSIYQLSTVFFPLLLIAVIKPEPFILGALTGVVLTGLRLLVSLRKYKGQRQQRQDASLDGHMMD